VCVLAPVAFFQRRVFGSNQKITTKLLACHEICLDFVSSPLLLFSFFSCFFFCLLLLRMQNVLLFYFVFLAPQKQKKKSAKCSCALEVVFFFKLFRLFVSIYNLNLQSVGRLPLHQIICRTLDRFISHRAFEILYKNKGILNIINKLKPPYRSVKSKC